MEKKLLEKKDPGPKGPTALALLTALIPGAFQPHTMRESTILREAVLRERRISLPGGTPNELSAQKVRLQGEPLR